MSWSQTVTGVAGELAVTTDDGRRIDPAGFRVRRRPIPLMAVGALGDPGGHDGAHIAGRLERVNVADGLIHVAGATDLPPGEYGCGMDLADCEGVMLDGETGGPLTEARIEAWLADHPDELVPLVELTTACELIAVTAYLPDYPGRPAFPRARLVVTA